jgi:hypothetical protein
MRQYGISKNTTGWTDEVEREEHSLANLLMLKLI